MSRQPYPSLSPATWLVERLRNITEFDPRYEASWYGPYNALLSHYFPYQQRFLIKPQSKIRDEQDADISFSSIQAESSMANDDPLPVDEDSSAATPAADTSMTSMGALVIPGSGPIYIPDFIVVKATQYASQDTALLVVEVKLEEPKTETGWNSHGYQISAYMRSLSRQSGDVRLDGLLICGTKVRIFKLEDAGSEVTEGGTTYNINSNTVRKVLWSIARDNWSYSG